MKNISKDKILTNESKTLLIVIALCVCELSIEVVGVTRITLQRHEQELKKCLLSISTLVATTSSVV